MSKREFWGLFYLAIMLLIALLSSCSTYHQKNYRTEQTYLQELDYLDTLDQIDQTLIKR